MTNKLFTVLDGIISAKEYASDNLSNIDNIIDCADAAGISIDSAEAELISKVGKKWLNETDNGNGEWSRMRHEAIAELGTD